MPSGPVALLLGRFRMAWSISVSVKGEFIQGGVLAFEVVSFGPKVLLETFSWMLCRWRLVAGLLEYNSGFCASWDEKV